MRPWLEGALVAWTMLMLAVILLALVPGTASSPMDETLPAEGEVLSMLPAPAQAPVPAAGTGMEDPPLERVTFAERWSPVRLPAMPATTVTPLALVAPRAPQGETEQIRIVPREVMTLRKKGGSGGVCARHGLRQVWVSSTRWRCKR